MKRIGLLFGAENTFPGSVVERINSMEIDDIHAEFVKVGAVNLAEPCPYSVIIDRISHDVPFYRAYLKNAVLCGTVVINNPFWWSADDKFFNYALASRLGVAVPRTVLLPHKRLPGEVSEQCVRNLEYPLDWESIFDYVKFPAFLKPHDGGAWRDVHYVRDRDEFFRAYDGTRDLCMTLQAAVEFEEYFRCYVVGQKDVRVMAYDPRQPHHLRYAKEPREHSPGVLERVERDALTLCRALGYDLNTVEFAVQGGVPYAIDFMNPAPDADRHSVGEANFEWIVDKVARLAVDMANRAGTPSPEFHWARFLAASAEDAANPGMARAGSVQRAREKKALNAAAAKSARKAAGRSSRTPHGPGTGQ